MQLLALSPKGQLVAADYARRGADYSCLECGSPLRLRSGERIRHHFYHLSDERVCRQSGKSLTHLQVQLRLSAIIPNGEAEMEVAFSSIGRIADVVWEKKRLIYEVQCSSITADEVTTRNRDYASLGYQVIWVMHDKRFNKRSLTAAEAYLWSQPHLYTDINNRNEGHFYDQFAIVKNGRRTRRLSRSPVDPTLIHPVTSKNHFSQRTLNRLEQWSYCFAGDVSYCEAFDDLSTPSEWEDNNSITKLNYWRLALARLKRAYQTLFYLALERTCR